MPSMPIDIKKLLDVVTNIGKQQDMPVHVDLIFDPTASSRLVDLIIDAFVNVQGASSKSKVHVNDSILGEAVPSISSHADLCVIVGGDSLLLGDVEHAAQELDVPAVVVIERGKTYFADDKDAAQKYADMTLAANSASTLSGNAKVPNVGRGVSLKNLIDVELDDDETRPLEALGVWIVQNVSDKRIPLASAFPFLRHPLAVELAKQSTLQNGAIGLVFFVPGADMPLIALNQAKMVLQIATVYGYDLSKERIREIVFVLAGGFGCRAIARKLVSQIPMLGWLVKPAVAASGTMGMAIAAIEFYEEEGRLHGLSGVADKAWEKAEPLVNKGADLVGNVVSGATARV